jgi:hypothetical protein
MIWKGTAGKQKVASEFVPEKRLWNLKTPILD